MTSSAQSVDQEAKAINDISGSPYSRPVFTRNVEIHSLQAQNILTRSYKRLSQSLFQTSVIMKINYTADEIANVDATIDKAFDEDEKAIAAEKARIMQLLADSDIHDIASYTHTESFTLNIDTPRAARFIRLVMGVDELVGLIDTLWLNAEISDHIKKDLTFKHQQRLIKTAASIIGLENRTRAAAARRKTDDPTKVGDVGQSEAETAQGLQEMDDFDHALEAEINRASQDDFGIDKKPAPKKQAQPALETAVA